MLKVYWQSVESCRQSPRRDVLSKYFLLSYVRNFSVYKCLKIRAYIYSLPFVDWMRECETSYIEVWNLKGRSRFCPLKLGVRKARLSFHLILVF